METVRTREAFDAAMATVPVIAIVRLPSATAAVPLASAVHGGGIRLIEVTLTTDGALPSVDAIRQARLDGLVVGVGTVRTAADARRAVDAGAEYLVTPTTRVEVVDAAQAAEVPVVCGGLTPTELDLAHQSGADYVKLFPASAVGPRYLREVLAPLPDMKVVPTGGVTVSNIPDFRAAGAAGVGVGSALVDAATVDAGEWRELERRAAGLVTAWRG